MMKTTISTSGYTAYDSRYIKMYLIQHGNQIATAYQSNNKSCKYLAKDNINFSKPANVGQTPLDLELLAEKECLKADK